MQAHHLQRIHVPGCLLRPFEERDAADFVQAARESLETAGAWLPWCHAGYNEDEARTWFRNCHVNARARNTFEFGVFATNGEHFLGSAGLNYIDWPNRCANLGYWVRQSRQRQGIATACVAALSEFGFRNLGLHRIEIVVAVGNEPSAAVARKSGALFEGIARNRLFLHGAPVAARVYSLVP
ncbi:GNAT family N-acetyltransferase [Azohydromonas caseinilytica]|uniref:GNAT family N-acetyltransferase n=1 Tax=Azohydromonas caseinilytica TaxID=2728836 RepID=A0A848FBL8_9BURK|nr:GNAT family N-acetyltransferase [Azohydromonas caseinilytica]NML15713.1 GNAT family N-acetyltransferase [Azohydromonas caseinilytica]